MRFLLSCVPACLILATQSLAQSLPPDQTVSYQLHADPEDPNSPVTVTTTVTLVASQESGSAVGWSISAIDIHALDGASQSTHWAGNLVQIQAPDGLWWITHSDPNAPQLTDFAVPPLLTGTVTNESNANLTMNFELEGNTEVPVNNTPFILTSFIRYFLLHPGNPGIIIEQEGPSEIHSGTMPVTE